MTKRFKQKLNSVFSITNIILMILQSFMPGFFALMPTQAYAGQETAEVVVEQVEEPESEQVEQIEEVTTEVVLEVQEEETEEVEIEQPEQPVESPVLVEEIIEEVLEVEPVLEATQEAVVAEETAQPIEGPAPTVLLETKVEIEDVVESEILDIEESVWEVSDGLATVKSVELNVAYTVPQNDKVQVTFTKLPENPGSLIVREVTLSDEQVLSLGAFSNVAYDISSNMEDGIFEYELKLPLPEGADDKAEMVYAESVEELGEAQDINDEVIEDGKVTASGLNHFTVFVVATGVTNGTNCTVASITGTCYDTLQAAVDAADPSDADGVDTIELASDLIVGQRVNVNKTVILDGNGHTISASFEKTSNSNNAALSISADNIIVTDLVVDGTGGYYVWNKQLHGINIYTASNVYLDNVTAKDFGGSGIVVNSSSVTVNNVKTSGNSWHGINVDKKTSDPSVLTVLGTSNHTDVLHIYVDDATKDVTVNDVENQYQINHPGVNSEPNDRLYTLNGTEIPGSHTYEFDFKTFDGGVAGLWATDYIHAQLELIPDGGNCYLYTRTDTGTFETLAGRSPNDTADILAGIKGDLSGGISGRICGDINNGDLSYKEDLTVGSYPSYAEKYFHRILDNISGFTFNSTNGWGWTFTTCNNGTWVDTDTEVSGDITGAYVPCDTTGPEAPVISYPSEGQYFNSTPILNDWNDVSDPSGIDHYRIKYVYDDGHHFSGEPYRTITASQRNHTPGIGEQGGVTIWVQAFDGAGNEGIWSQPVHYFYDATAPDAPTLTSPLDGAWVTGNPTQIWDAVSDADHYEYESSLDSGFSSIAYSTTVNGTSRTVGGNQTVTFWWRVRAVDAAGNKSPWSDEWQLNINNTVPTTPTYLGFNKQGSSSLSDTPQDLSCGVAVNGSFKTSGLWTDVSGSGYNVRYIRHNQRPGGLADILLGQSDRVTLSSSVDADNMSVLSTLSDDYDNFYSGWGTFGGNEGLYKTRVRAYSDVNNNGKYDVDEPISDWSNSCEVTYDKTAPDISIDSIKYSNGTTSTKFTTNYNTPVILGSVISSDTTSVVLNVNGHDYTATINAGKTEWEATVTDAIPDGDHVITVTATDLAGNSQTFTKNIFVDTVAPAATHTYFKDGAAITNPIAYAQTLGAFTFTGSYEDVLPSSNLYWDSFVIFQAQDDGSFRFSANGKQAYCGWRSTPNLVNLSGSSYSFGTPVPFTDCTSTLVDGEYYMAHHIYDTATRKDIPSINQFRDVLGLHFVIDTVKPTSTITTFDLPDDGETKTATFSGQIQGTATDDNSGVAEVLLEIMHTPFGATESSYWNGSDWQTPMATVSVIGTTTWEYQITPAEKVLEGTYVVKSHAVDNAGNVESTYTITIVYDKTIPEVTLTMDPTDPDGRNSWYVTEPTATLTANDNYNVDYIQYQWNSTAGTWTTYASPINPPAEGQNVLYYRSIDVVGNVSDLGVKEVKWDQTAPTDGAGNLQVKNIQSTTADATWNEPANSDEIDRFVLIWKHEDGSTRSTSEPGDVFETELFDLFDGEWELTLESQDAAGNVYSVTERFTVGGSPDDGAVLGVADTEGTTGLGGFVAGLTQGDSNTEDSKESKETATEEVTDSGEVLGDSDNTCATWKFYLPLFLLLIQLMFAVSLEIANREPGSKKILSALAISGLMMASFYILRDVSCYGETTGVIQLLSKWFVLLSIGLALLLRVLGSMTVEEK